MCLSRRLKYSAVCILYYDVVCRATESLLLDFTDASFSKFQSSVAGGTFDQAFVKGDSLLFIGRSEASATACILPYDMGELTGQKRVYEVVNMFKDSVSLFNP